MANFPKTLLLLNYKALKAGIQWARDDEGPIIIIIITIIIIQVDTDKLPVKERFIIVDDMMLKRN